MLFKIKVVFNAKTGYIPQVNKNGTNNNLLL